MKTNRIISIIFPLVIVLSLLIPTSVLAMSVPEIEKTIDLETVPSVSYKTHVQDVGWQGWKKDGEMAGTSGQSLRLEAINIDISNNTDEKLNIKYQVHVQDIGWQGWKKNGEMAGTSGQSLRLEAIKISLENSSEYSIMYRVHVQDIGWQEWKKDGEIAGTTGQSLRLEAIEIKIVEKEKRGKIYIDTPTNNVTYYNLETAKITVSGWKMANVSNAKLKAYIDDKEINSNSFSYRERPDVLNAIKDYGTKEQNPQPGFKFDIDTTTLTKGKHTIKIELYNGDKILTQTSTVFNLDTDIHLKYQTHVQDVGWQDWKENGDIAGTTGLSKQVEALKIQLLNAPQGAKIKYRAYVQDAGWQAWKENGDIAGTTGLSKKIEALEIKLEGLEGYTVEYRAHVQDIGWQNWLSDSMTSGTLNQKLRLEALQMRVVKKEKTVVPQIKYSSYTSTNNWENYENGAIAGSENSKTKIEALKISLSNVASNVKIKYQVHSQNIGWMDYVANGVQAGVIGQNNGIEAIKINIEGLPGYSIEYRVYVNGTGWQNWVRNGKIAGTTGEDKQIGAIQIKINGSAYANNQSDYENINRTKYPGYFELLENLQNEHPNWTFKLLYTGLKFSEVVNGEYSRHSANLVPIGSGNEWICSVCGTKTYDTGKWYGASDKAIAYYMDPRNFLNESNVFQFLDVNKYDANSVTIEGIKNRVSKTFLVGFENDIDTACRNKGVNAYYVISRLIQENGSGGSATSKGMNGGDGKTYYNPFNIGASGNTSSEVYANALARAKSEGWDTMEKALEGGIVFLKANWLENYQNTLYQNKFDIDTRNGTSLYSHQYMQNLSAAYSEGNSLRGHYANTSKLDSEFTFIIPVYENMSSNLSPRPSDKTDVEEYPMNVIVNTQSTSLALREEASTSSKEIARYDKGTVVLSVRRGINTTWHHVVTKDGKVGYMSGQYLKQVSDEKNCNYSAYVKTKSSGGVNVRSGPSTTAGFSKIEYLKDYTQVTVIDDSTYRGYEGANWVQWCRIVLSDGRQAFVPSSYVYKN